MKILPPDKSPSAELARKRIDPYFQKPVLFKLQNGVGAVSMDYQTYLALQMIERLIDKGNK